MAPATRLLQATALLGGVAIALGGCGDNARGAGTTAGAASASGGGVMPTRVQRAMPEDAGLPPGHPKLVSETKNAPKQTAVCSLVTRQEAQAILKRTLLKPLEAPQGPTCIYRARSGRNLATVAVQTGSITQIRRQLRHARKVRVGGRTAYCGTFGRPSLFLPLSGGRVLTVTASCAKARRFAAHAVRRL